MNEPRNPQSEIANELRLLRIQMDMIQEHLQRAVSSTNAPPHREWSNADEAAWEQFWGVRQDS